MQMFSVLRHASVSKVDEIHSNGRIVGCSMDLVLVGIVPVIGEDGVHSKQVWLTVWQKCRRHQTVGRRMNDMRVS